jgi:hypothetical protein
MVTCKNIYTMTSKMYQEYDKSLKSTQIGYIDNLLRRISSGRIGSRSVEIIMSNDKYVAFWEEYVITIINTCTLRYDSIIMDRKPNTVCVSDKTIIQGEGNYIYLYNRK